MIKFAIRDDDTCFFTRPAELESIYGEIWHRVPVSLAVVPFQFGFNEKRIPEQNRDHNNLFRLAENQLLVEWLKEGINEKRIAVMQHGYSHWDSGSTYEFRDGHDLHRKVKEGRLHLQDTLGIPITAFVPPHNSFSRKGFIAVIKAGLNIVGIPSFRPNVRRIKLKDIIPYWRYKYFCWKFKSQEYRYPWPLWLSDHGEMACYTLVPGVTFTQLKEGLDFVSSMDGVFCLATHYWELLEFPEMQNVLNQLVDYVFTLSDVNPITVPAIFKI